MHLLNSSCSLRPTIMGIILSEYFSLQGSPTPKIKTIHYGTRNHRYFVTSGFSNNRGQKSADLVISEPRNNSSSNLSELGLFDFWIFSYFFFFLAHFYFPASGQAVVTGVVPFPPRFLPQFVSRIGFSNSTARRFFIECC